MRIAVSACLFLLVLWYGAVASAGTIDLRQTDGTKTEIGGVGKYATVHAESQFTHSAVVTADTQIKASAGYVHNLVCIGADVAATAGTVILYDNTAESGTVVVSWDVQALNYSNPVRFPVDAVMTTGIYLGFTTTADVKCYVSYR